VYNFHFTDIPSMVIKESSLWVSPNGNEIYTFALVDKSHTTYGSTSYLHGVLLDKITALQVFIKFPAFYGTRKGILCSKKPANCPYPEPD
jgi:hypothetical protein